MNLMGNDHFPGNPSYNANKDAECASGSICTNQCIIPNGYCHAMYKSFIIISIYSKHTPRCLHKVKWNNNKPIKQVGMEESVWERTGQCEKLHRDSHEGESSQRGRLSRRCTSEIAPRHFFLTFQKGSSSCPRPPPRPPGSESIYWNLQNKTTFLSKYSSLFLPPTLLKPLSTFS